MPAEEMPRLFWFRDATKYVSGGDYGWRYISSEFDQIIEQTICSVGEVSRAGEEDLSSV